MPLRSHPRVIALSSIAIVVAVVAVLVGVFLHREDTSRSEPRDVTIAIAVQDDIFPALVYIAEDQGYFEEEGVHVTLRSFPSAKMALRATLAGESHMATTAGVPIAWQTLHGANVSILCTLGFTDRAFRVIARRDRGVETPDDLAGKTIATQEASAEHLFLDVFLAYHGLDRSRARIVFMPAMNLPDALIDGEIDAFALRQPFVGEASSSLNDRAIVFAGPDYYRAYFALVTTPGFFDEDNGDADAVLRALVRAERLLHSNTPEAVNSVTRQLGEARRKEIEHGWPEYRFEVAAGQSFLVNLESEARWLMREYPDLAGPTPDYLEMFHTKPLLRVRPESVTVWK